jgi:hypothetical protein
MTRDLNSHPPILKVLAWWVVAYRLGKRR